MTFKALPKSMIAVGTAGLEPRDREEGYVATLACVVVPSANGVQFADVHVTEKQLHDLKETIECFLRELEAQ